jgi:hypothetical protein
MASSYRKTASTGLGMRQLKAPAAAGRQLIAGASQRNGLVELQSAPMAGHHQVNEFLLVQVRLVD